MKKSHQISAIIVAVIALSSCAGTPSSVDTRLSSPRPIPGASAAEWQSTLAPVGLAAAREKLTANDSAYTSCMAEAGFQGEKGILSLGNLPEVEPATEAYIARYGFGITTLAGSLAGVGAELAPRVAPPDPTPSDSPRTTSQRDADRQLAMRGDQRRPGCLVMADLATLDLASLRSGVLSKAVARDTEFQSLIEADEALTKLKAEWLVCMSSAGYSVRNGEELAQQVTDRYVAARSAAIGAVFKQGEIDSLPRAELDRLQKERTEAAESISAVVAFELRAARDAWQCSDAEQGVSISAAARTNALQSWLIRNLEQLNATLEFARGETCAKVPLVREVSIAPKTAAAVAAHLESAMVC